MRQRHFVDERRALNHVGRRVDMGGVVHRGRDALRQHARLRHVMDALDLDVFEIRPVRRLVAEAMGQVVELSPIELLRFSSSATPRIFLTTCILPGTPTLMHAYSIGRYITVPDIGYRPAVISSGQDRAGKQTEERMVHKIALEEHFLAPGYEAYWRLTVGNVRSETCG